MASRLRGKLTFANVASALALFIALGTGTAFASYIITSNSQVGPHTISGHKPPSGDAANIISGSITGKDVVESSLTGDTRKLLYSAGGSSGTSTIATVGPYAIKASCTTTGFPDFELVFQLLVNGPAGTANVMYDTTENDSSDLGTSSKGLNIPASTDFSVVDAQVPADSGEYDRVGGTAMLQTGSTLVQVDFDAIADGRASVEGCLLYGTATNAT